MKDQKSFFINSRDYLLIQLPVNWIGNCKKTHENFGCKVRSKGENGFGSEFIVKFQKALF